MTIEELSLFLMRVNSSYSKDCMVGIADCKYPNIDNNCSLCFKEWLERDVDDND